jgi:ornithine cyclodeaminase/alanine dehydrogenase-like protein (mu-crystallin family)
VKEPKFITGKVDMYRILTDPDIEAGLPMENAISAIETAFRARAQGKLLAPPRFSVGTVDGSLVFTAGSELEYFHAIGFRVYGRFPLESPDRTQFVAVFDNQTGGFKGLVIGNFIGAIRTAAINAVAIKHLARPDTSCLGILGSGFQAGFHARAAMTVRPFDQALVYSPTRSHREEFAGEMSEKTGTPFQPCSTPEQVVRHSDVLIVATTSPRPVFDASWLRVGTHINTIGPKYRNRHELPLEAAQLSQVIATDSIEQAGSYDKPYFLSGSAEWDRMLELSSIVVGNQKGRLSDGDITLFCSVGLSGTEVVIADEALRLACARGEA